MSLKFFSLTLSSSKFYLAFSRISRFGGYGIVLLLFCAHPAHASGTPRNGVRS